MSEGAFVEFDGPSAAELAVPPTLFAVPSTSVARLQPGQLVTVATSGGWLVDEHFVVDGPFGGGVQESYSIASAHECQRARHQVGDDLRVTVRLSERRVPAAQVWVYRAAPGSSDLFEMKPWTSALWFDNVRREDASASPPARRSPRPARELPSLSGRRLYGPALSADGRPTSAWTWWVAVSEPLEEEGGFFVRVLSMAGYGIACDGGASNWVGMPLHRLFAY